MISDDLEYSSPRESLLATARGWAQACLVGPLPPLSAGGRGRCGPHRLATVYSFDANVRDYLSKCQVTAGFLNTLGHGRIPALQRE
jgi:hypothetical protein